jgi:DNA invertase Pin-like site-specific DNA recombinase
MRNNKSIRRGLKEKIIALAEQGWSYNMIKRRLNCSKSTISYHLGEGQKEKSRARVRKQRDKSVRYIENNLKRVA